VKISDAHTDAVNHLHLNNLFIYLLTERKHTKNNMTQIIFVISERTAEKVVRSRASGDRERTGKDLILFKHAFYNSTKTIKHIPYYRYVTIFLFYYTHTQIHTHAHLSFFICFSSRSQVFLLFSHLFCRRFLIIVVSQ
jgi:hypothetical protein